MRFAKILSVATLPMFFYACGGDSMHITPPPGDDNPQDQPKDSIPPNIPDSLLSPITRDFSKVWNGEGTAENPYQIASEEDLSNLSFYVDDSSMSFRDKFFKQTADIVLKKAWKPIGLWGKNLEGLSKRPFSGSFDGGSKTITGLSISDTASYSGLFGYTFGAHISNVVLKNVNMSVGAYAGSVAGKVDSTTIENCTFENVEISGADRVGGLVGAAAHTKIVGVSGAGTVQGSSIVGGLVGFAQDGSITDASNNSSVTGTSTVGGVVGSFASVSSEGVISSAFNHGAVVGSKDVGGVIASLSGSKLEKSGNYGTVTADDNKMSNVGGVVAVASSKSVLNEIFNVATVTAKKAMAAGGVVGSLKYSTATNMFNIGEVAGSVYGKTMGGIVGIVDGSDSKLSSSYNAGKIPNENYSGAVIGRVSATEDIKDVYFDKTVGAGCLEIADHMLVNVPSGLSTEDMKAAAFIATLNGSGNVWKAGSATFGGYPAFSWLE